MLAVIGLSKQFGSVVAIDHLTFDLPDDAITCLLAPSGAGKSTLLRILAGLEQPTAGTILIDGEPVNGPTPKAILVPQSDMLFSHMKVHDQIEFGTLLRRNRQRLDAGDTKQHVSRIAKELGLENLWDRYPVQLSGGQRQRVSLGRALAVQPRILLCDEPFSSLDEMARHELRNVILSIHRDFRLSVLFVSHSVPEAVFLGHEVWVCDGPPLRFHKRIVVPFGTERPADLLDRVEFRRVCQQVRLAHSDSVVDTPQD